MPQQHRSQQKQQSAGSARRYALRKEESRRQEDLHRSSASSTIITKRDQKDHNQGRTRSPPHQPAHPGHENERTNSLRLHQQRNRSPITEDGLFSKKNAAVISSLPSSTPLRHRQEVMSIADKEEEQDLVPTIPQGIAAAFAASHGRSLSEKKKRTTTVCVEIERTEAKIIGVKTTANLFSQQRPDKPSTTSKPGACWGRQELLDSLIPGRTAAKRMYAHEPYKRVYTTRNHHNDDDDKAEVDIRKATYTVESTTTTLDTFLHVLWKTFYVLTGFGEAASVSVVQLQCDLKETCCDLYDLLIMKSIVNGKFHVFLERVCGLNIFFYTDSDLTKYPDLQSTCSRHSSRASRYARTYSLTVDAALASQQLARLNKALGEAVQVIALQQYYFLPSTGENDRKKEEEEGQHIEVENQPSPHRPEGKGKWVNNTVRAVITVLHPRFPVFSKVFIQGKVKSMLNKKAFVTKQLATDG